MNNLVSIIWLNRRTDLDYSVFSSLSVGWFCWLACRGQSVGLSLFPKKAGKRLSCIHYYYYFSTFLFLFLFFFCRRNLFQKRRPWRTLSKLLSHWWKATISQSKISVQMVTTWVLLNQYSLPWWPVNQQVLWMKIH